MAVGRGDLAASERCRRITSDVSWIPDQGVSLHQGRDWKSKRKSVVLMDRSNRIVTIRSGNP